MSELCKKLKVSSEQGDEIMKIVCDINVNIVHTRIQKLKRNIILKQHLFHNCAICDFDSRNKFIEVEPSVVAKFENEENLELVDVIVNTPLRVNMLYNNCGWKKFEIFFLPICDIDQFILTLGKCCHCVNIKCTIGNFKTQDTSDFQTDNTNMIACVDLSEFGLNTSCATLRTLSFSMFINSESPEIIVQKEYDNHTKNETLSCSDSNRSRSWSVVSEQISAKNFLCVTNLNTEPLNNASNSYEGRKLNERKRIFNKSDNILSCTTTEVIAETKSSSSRFAKKSCPFFKKIPGTSFVVDAFQYGNIPGVSHYFLSHFHYDHYCGLRKAFKYPLICGRVTATLVKKKINVEDRYFHIVDHMKTFTIGDVHITPLDANHCPGSLMFLFQLKNGQNILHVGDFRANKEMENYPALLHVNIDILFLDTTYCNPRYEFPTQDDVVSKVVELALQYVAEDRSTLIISGTYTIGKEKIFLKVADALHSNIWASKSKSNILKCLGIDMLTQKLVEIPLKAQVHVWPMTDFYHESFESHLESCKRVFKRIVAFNPSGWNFRPKCKVDYYPAVTKGRVTIINVPYSEHSSYNELRTFVKFCKPSKIVPTVATRNSSFAAITKDCMSWLLEDDNKYSPETQQKLTKFFSKS